MTVIFAFFFIIWLLIFGVKLFEAISDPFMPTRGFILLFISFILTLIFGFLLNATPAQADSMVDMGNFKITAYCPCEECSEGFGRKTSRGTHAESERTIAVDPDIIDYGSKVLIDGNIYIAEDCGGKVNGDHIDIFFDTHEEVKDFGTNYKHVWIVR